MIVKREQQHHKSYCIAKLNVVFSQCLIYFQYAERRSLISRNGQERILQYQAVNYGKAGSNTCTHSVLLKTAGRMPQSALVSSPISMINASTSRMSTGINFVSRRHKLTV